jgi:hypothetical protein
MNNGQAATSPAIRKMERVRRMKNLGIFLILIVVPYGFGLLMDHIVGVDSDGNHWGSLGALLILFYVWLPATVVYIIVSITAAVLARKGRKETAYKFNVGAIVILLLLVLVLCVPLIGARR